MISNRKTIAYIDTDIAKDIHDIDDISKSLLLVIQKLNTCSTSVIISTICGFIETIADLEGFDKLTLLKAVNKTVINHIYGKEC